MQISRCDKCNKILDKKTDRFYSVGEISFSAPGDSVTRVVFDKSIACDSQSVHVESWTNYADLDICTDCWGTFEIWKYARK